MLKVRLLVSLLLAVAACLPGLARASDDFEAGLATLWESLWHQSGIPTRVVSTPCWELFEKQSAAYRKTVIGAAPVRVAVEAAVKFGWERFIGEDGVFVGMTGFGASAPFERLYKEFGITAEAVVEAAKAKL